MKRFLFVLLGLSFCILNYAQNLDAKLSSEGYVDISQLDSSIHIHLMYAYPDNFMGQAVYEGLTKAWLRPEAATMLVNAQRLLKTKHPEWSLIVYDAARPMSVQRKMWSIVRGTDKTNYVSNPANGGGLHNYGMAVDVSILDEKGIPLSMGSPVDFFSEEAHINNEEVLLKSGKITKNEYDNRRLLRQVMQDAGFRTILYEWWHFNACTRAQARERYPVIE